MMANTDLWPQEESVESRIQISNLSLDNNEAFAEIGSRCLLVSLQPCDDDDHACQTDTSHVYIA